MWLSRVLTEGLPIDAKTCKDNCKYHRKRTGQIENADSHATKCDQNYEQDS